MAKLVVSPSVEKSHEKETFVFDQPDSTCDEQAVAPSLTLTAVNKMKIAELKEELTKRGLSKTGKKAELTQRLLQACDLTSSAVASPAMVKPVGEKRKQMTGSGTPNRHQVQKTPLNGPGALGVPQGPQG